MNGSLIKVFLFIISSLKLNLHILHPAVLSIAGLKELSDLEF